MWTLVGKNGMRGRVGETPTYAKYVGVSTVGSSTCLLTTCHFDVGKNGMMFASGSKNLEEDYR